MAGFKYDKKHIYYEKHIWQNQDGNEEMPTDAPSISADNLQEMDDAIEEALLRTGGEMEGDLLLKGFPEEAMSAVPKEYADTNIMYIYETYSQTGTYTKKIEGFKADKYLPLVFHWNTAVNTSKHFKIANYDEKTPFFIGGSDRDNRIDYVTIGSDGNIAIERNYEYSGIEPLVVIFLPAKKI